MLLCHAFVVTRDFISPTVSQNKPLHKYLLIYLFCSDEESKQYTDKRDLCVTSIYNVWGWESGPVVLRCFLLSSLDGVQ